MRLIFGVACYSLPSSSHFRSLEGELSTRRRQQDSGGRFCGSFSPEGKMFAEEEGGIRRDEWPEETEEGVDC